MGYEGCSSAARRSADGKIREVFREKEISDAVAGHKFTGDDASSLKRYVPKAGGTIVSGDVKYRITGNGEPKTAAAVRPAGDGATDISIPAFISHPGFDWEVASTAWIPRLSTGMRSRTRAASKSRPPPGTSRASPSPARAGS